MKLVIFASLLIIISCISITKQKKGSPSITNENKTSEIQVNYYLNICNGEGTHLCLQIKENKEKRWRNIFGLIDGFEYEWGYNYNLKVLKEKNQFPSVNGATYNYKLIEILSKEKVSDDKIFSLEFDGSDVNKKSGEYLLLNIVNIEFGNPIIQDLLIKKLSRMEFIKAKFKMGKKPNSIQLIEL